MHAVKPTENIDTYMTDIDEFKGITVEREIELYHMMHTGDPNKREDARNELITSNLRLVVKIAHDFKKYGVTFADLVQEGNVGLMTAADKFDPKHGAKFSYFAAFWIKQSMRKAILNQSRTIRIPNCAAQMSAKLHKIKQRYLAEKGRLPTMEESAQELGVSEERIEGLSFSDIQIASINEKIDEDSDTTFEEVIHSETDEAQAKQEEVSQAVDATLNLLKTKFSDMDRFIILHAYGIDCKPLTPAIIAQETGLSEIEISIRMRRICKELKPMLKDMCFDL